MCFPSLGHRVHPEGTRPLLTGDGASSAHPARGTGFGRRSSERPGLDTRVLGLLLPALRVEKKAGSWVPLRAVAPGNTLSSKRLRIQPELRA